MTPEKRYPFLTTLLSPFWKRHQKTLGLIISSIATTGQARSFAIATTLARWLGIRLDSAVNRFYRLLRNTRIDYLVFAQRWADVLARSPARHLIVSIDWTEWHHDLRLLVAAVVTGKRAIPLYVHGFRKAIRTRSQNTQENTFLRLLADALRRAEVTATILCDRGFRRASWLKLLQELKLRFAVRLMTDVHVELEPGTKVALRDILIKQGQFRDLGLVSLRSDGAVLVRVVGYWVPGAHEPWWIATSETGPASCVIKLYDRRMTVEEQFRDIKGRRFGVKLSWTQFRDPEALARFVMLLAVALLIWIITGIAASKEKPCLRLRCKKKGPRQSFVTIGLRICAVDSVPIPIRLAELATHLEPPYLRTISRLSPGGK